MSKKNRPITAIVNLYVSTWTSSLDDESEQLEEHEHAIIVRNTAMYFLEIHDKVSYDDVMLQLNQIAKREEILIVNIFGDDLSEDGLEILTTGVTFNPPTKYELDNGFNTTGSQISNTRYIGWDILLRGFCNLNHATGNGLVLMFNDPDGNKHFYRLLKAYLRTEDVLRSPFLRLVNNARIEEYVRTNKNHLHDFLGRYNFSSNYASEHDCRDLFFSICYGRTMREFTELTSIEKLDTNTNEDSVFDPYSTLFSYESLGFKVFGENLSSHIEKNIGRKYMGFEKFRDYFSSGNDMMYPFVDLPDFDRRPFYVASLNREFLAMIGGMPFEDIHYTP